VNRRPRKPPREVTCSPSDGQRRRGERAANKRRVAAALESRRRRDGTFSRRLLNQVAETAGISYRTVLRAVNAEPIERSAWRGSVDMLPIIAKHQALRPAYVELADAGRVDKSYNTFRRWWLENYPQSVRDGIIFGTKAMPAVESFNEISIARRNEVWILDGMSLPAHARDATGQRITPGLITVIDGASRVVLACRVCAVSTAEVVTLTLAEAMYGFSAPDGTFVGGRPDRVAWDNGNEFLADVVTVAVLNAGVTPEVGPIYTPWLRGRLERWHNTIQDQMCRRLPGYTHGQRSRHANRAYTTNDVAKLWTLDLIQAEVDAWLLRYNSRDHGAL
jgi:transposase InsO family protein